MSTCVGTVMVSVNTPEPDDVSVKVSIAVLWSPVPFPASSSFKNVVPVSVGVNRTLSVLKGRTSDVTVNSASFGL